MARCFCGCGRKVKFGMRPVNTRGGMIRGDVALVEDLLARGVISPNAEMFVHDGRVFCETLAHGVHVGVDPGPEIEHEARGFMAFARHHFSEAAIGRTIEAAGLSVEEAARALSEGRFDPFADLDYPRKERSPRNGRDAS